MFFLFTVLLKFISIGMFYYGSLVSFSEDSKEWALLDEWELLISSIGDV